MKLYETLENQLKKENNFVTDEGELKKWVVIGKARNYDPVLIKLLLANETLKEKFFVEVEGTLVFKQEEFITFMEMKNYLNDSYTKYKNKVGLTIDGKYLKQRNEVSLVWPFKDCVLEGGQTKEEQKREEIFFNEILAQDEITQLFEPKVLTNVQVYDKDGEKEFKSFTRDAELNKKRGLPEDTITDNLIIKGNNLLALHSLKKEFAGKVKLIYIDPPYNTGGDANTFAYNNTYNHSTWLTFMKNRLFVAKKLLKKDGVICIAIDDEEYAHLKLLSDEVFGRQNFIGTIIVQSNPRGRTTNSYFATSHEYALFYGQNIENVIIHNQPLNEQQEKDFNEIDSNGKFRYLPFRRSGGTSTPEERPNSEFTLYYSIKHKNIIAIGGDRIDVDLTKKYRPKEILRIDETSNKIVKIKPSVFFQENKDVIEILPIDKLGKRRVWRWSDREKIIDAALNGDLKIKKDGDRFTVYLKDRIKEGRKPKTIWTDSKYDASANGTMLLKNIFEGNKLFSYPKSIYTVKDTIQIITGFKSNDIILDFFGGSGTTAHAVLELNKEDGGNRQFILVEQMDYIETVTVPRVKKVLEINNEKTPFTYLELKKYNQIFIEKIQGAKTTEELLAIWEQMKERSFLNYNVDLKKQEEHIEEFKQLSIEEQKQHLVEILDKNQLYVNLSSMNDKDFEVPEEEKQVTKDFYQIKKD